MTLKLEDLNLGLDRIAENPDELKKLIQEIREDRIITKSGNTKRQQKRETKEKNIVKQIESMPEDEKAKLIAALQAKLASELPNEQE